MFLTPPLERPLQTRDGFLIVALAWFAVSALGAVPFILVGGFDWVTAIFESASGFTTTGAPAIVGLDTLPRSLLFFRQEIQWLGGIGVIVAAIALLPMLGIGGMQLLKAETTGPAKSDKLRPRIKHTAQALWRLYVLLTVGCALAYWFAGMPAFDAVAHSFTIVSTGGFSILYPRAAGGAHDIRAVHARVLACLTLSNVDRRTRHPDPRLAYQNTLDSRAEMASSSNRRNG